MTLTNHHNNQYSEAAQALFTRIGYPQSLPIEFETAKIVETHLSVVLMGNDYVLKFKKAVSFPFVDHRNIATRWNSAVNEIVLNKRLSKDIYLGLIAIFNSATKLSIADLLKVEKELDVSKDLLDVAVLMRRIPENQMLSQLIYNEQVTVDEHIIPLSKHLAKFHNNEIANNVTSGTFSYFKKLTELANENVSTIRNNCQELLLEEDFKLLDFISAKSNSFLNKQEELINKREAESLIIDGHGDLRAEHVCYTSSGVSVIDCIEFSASIREVDILSDVAFLRMDFDYLQRGNLATAFIDEYADNMGEPANHPVLLNFYSAYRAMVRAKVQLLRASELAKNNTTINSAELSKELKAMRNYIALASRYCWQIPSPCLIVVSGLMGVGKSTIANWIASNIYAEVLSTDAIRKEIFGANDSDKKLSFGESKYSIKATEKTYEEVQQRALNILNQGNPVIVDGSYIKQKHRLELLESVKKLNLPIVLVLCELEEEEQKRRLEARFKKGDSISDGRLELLDKQKNSAEKFSEEEVNYLVRVSTGDIRNLEILKTIISKLTK
jgi:aminoglycoside phosphotransferase family enzyme/predicted kinase